MLPLGSYIYIYIYIFVWHNEKNYISAKNICYCTGKFIHVIYKYCGIKRLNNYTKIN